MSSTLTCDQAIFTSIRTPTGEGYRIVAASRHLTTPEKQIITRNSPSHDSLCLPKPGDNEDDPGQSGASFFALPTGRLCVSHSCLAGAEHTGRGGQRVYTHHLVFNRSDFASCAYNPFVILRAMDQAGLTSPQVPPPSKLDELELPISDCAQDVSTATIGTLLGSPWRRHCLQALLNDESLIINLDNHWKQVAEAFVLGLPGPARHSLSFSAGIRFSTGRCHRLSLVYDDCEKTKKRIAGKKVTYVDPNRDEVPDTVSAPWLSFVDGHWDRGELETLAARTSLSFKDVSNPARDRVGQLYCDLDSLSDAPLPRLFQLAIAHLKNEDEGVEADMAAELVVQAQRTILGRLDATQWPEVQMHMERICSAWRDSDLGALFAWPIIERMLDVAIREHPLVAARVALPLARSLPPHANQAVCAAAFDRVLGKLADWAQGAIDNELHPLPELYTRWKSVLLHGSNLERLHRRCESLTALHTDG